MTISEEMKEFLKKQPNQIKKDLISFLQKSLTKDRITIVKGELCCPSCRSVHYKKNGHDGNGEQRYICCDCKKSFSDKTKSFFYHCRLPKEKWLQFIDLEITGMTLKEEAYYLGVSKTTCFFMRHKLYRCLALLYKKETLSGEVELDAAYFKINLKGTKPEKMPRYSKTRGNTSAFSGISHHKICAIVAVDENDHMSLKISGLGGESLEKYESQLAHFEKVKTMISDSKSCIPQFCNLLECEHDVIPVIANKKQYTTPNGNHLGDINELVEGFRTSIKYKKGIGTRYLQDELDFYTVKKKLKYQMDRSEIKTFIFNLLCEAGYISTEEIVLSDLPISLKEAYFDYHYGIFSESQQLLN